MIELTHKKHFFSVQLPHIFLGLAALAHLFYTQEYQWLLATFVFWFVAYVMGEGITYHRYGTKRFDTDDEGRNITWLSWLTWVGSGALQNNHHAYPGRWHDSHAWYEFDIGKYIIPLIATEDLKKL